MTPITYHAKGPQEFEDVLGTRPYFLAGKPASADEDALIEGLDYEDLYMTPGEREVIDKGGVPLCGIQILYLTSLQKRQSQKKSNND